MKVSRTSFFLFICIIRIAYSSSWNVICKGRKGCSISCSHGTLLLSPLPISLFDVVIHHTSLSLPRSFTLMISLKSISHIWVLPLNAPKIHSFYVNVSFSMISPLKFISSSTSLLLFFWRGYPAEWCSAISGSMLTPAGRRGRVAWA